MPHSRNSFRSYPVSTGIFNFIYWPTRCEVRGNSITLNRKTVIACERNSDWSQSDCIRAVSGSIDAYVLAKPDRWFAITYFECLYRPVLPLCPLFALTSSFSSFLKSTHVTVNENSAPFLWCLTYAYSWVCSTSTIITSYINCHVAFRKLKSSYGSTSPLRAADGGWGLFPTTKPQPITPIYEPATLGKDKAQYIGVKLM